MNWLPWAPLSAATLHIFEEFAWPGGFAARYRQYAPTRAKSITPRFLVIGNGLLLMLGYDAGAWWPAPFGAAVWLTTAALLASNATWHLIGTIRTKSCSPGIATGLILYVPLALFGYVRTLRSGTNIVTAIVAAAIGTSYHSWSAALHRRRAR
jgi:hypothetical protein